MDMEISEKLKDLLLEKGATMVGFADLSELPEEVRDGKRYGVSIGVALNPLIVKEITSGPTREYYGEYQRVNRLLADLADDACEILIEAGYEAIAKKPTNVGIDSTQSTILPHKTVATRAGIGWIGKCALLVTEEYGSGVRITTVLTNAPLETALPVNESKCGACSLCVEACPAQAPSGENWNVNKPRDSFFQALQCRETALHNVMTKLNINETICGICIAVCPWTKWYIERCLP